MALATKRDSFRRRANVSLIIDRAHYDEVILGAVVRARVSVWIATANLKELHLEAAPGTRARATPLLRACVGVIRVRSSC